MFDCVAMHQCSYLKLILVGFLLKCITITGLKADLNTSLKCLNDYLYNVDCSLKIHSENTSASNISYRLTLTETFDRTTHQCVLTNIKDDYFCSITTSTPTPDDDDNNQDIFSDTKSYEISLCHHKDDEPDMCELLEENYLPHQHIKPNPPCCLSVDHNSSRHRFAWRSTYESYGDLTALVDRLEYQLNFYKTADKKRVLTQNIRNLKEYSVKSEHFLPNTKYAAQVRTIPFNIHFLGEWSHWSAEVFWKTETSQDLSPKTFSIELRVVFVVIGLAVILASFMGCVSFKKWRRNTFIPTPVPYFHTLYTDCKGDFKSWIVTQENAGDMPTVEHTLPIDTLIKCMKIQEDEAASHSGAYSNIPPPRCDHRASYGHLPVLSQSGSPELDSGCWLCSDTSLEKEPLWYCNEYCTLNKTLNPIPGPTGVKET